MVVYPHRPAVQRYENFYGTGGVTLPYQMDGVSRLELQAMFRMGQKDMKKSILELIRGLADSASGVSHLTLITLAEMIEGIEVKA